MLKRWSNVSQLKKTLPGHIESDPKSQGLSAPRKDELLARNVDLLLACKVQDFFFSFFNFFSLEDFIKRHKTNVVNEKTGQSSSNMLRSLRFPVCVLGLEIS